jgi:hypothetical protein
MKCLLTCAALALAGVTACATAPEPAPAAVERGALPPAAAPADGRALPAGTDLHVELVDSIGARSRVGDLFTAAVRTPVVAVNGAIVVPEGSIMTGMITGVDPSDGPGDQAAILVNFLRIRIGNTTHPVAADVIDARRGSSDVGVVITGDQRAVLIAGPLGPGIGSIINLGTGTGAPTLPAGASMTVRTRDTIELR